MGQSVSQDLQTESYEKNSSMMLKERIHNVGKEMFSRKLNGLIADLYQEDSIQEKPLYTKEEIAP